MPKTKSKLWQSFTKVDNGAKCSLCQTVVKTCGNTTNMARHLSRNHRLHYDSEFGDSQLNENEQPKIVNALQRIKSYQDGDDRKAVDERFVWFIVWNALPFSIGESKGFQDFIAKLNKHYKLPGRNKVTNMINELYIRKKDQLKNYIEPVRWFCITTDGWKDTKNDKCYLGITLHFIIDYAPESVCFVEEFSGSHTADAIADKVNDVLAEWEIAKDQIVAVVSDGAANMKAAAEKIASGKYVHCVAHRLNLVVEDLFKASPDLTYLVHKVKTIVTFFKQSNLLMDELTNQRIRSGKDTRKVIQDVITRWNSTYLIIERYLELHVEISQVLIISRNKQLDLSDDEIVVLIEIKEILEPFYEMTNDISGEKYITISRIIPLLSCLRTMLEISKPLHVLSRDVKQILKDCLKERFAKVEQEELFAFATLLDPRFRKLDFSSTSACAMRVAALNNMLSEVELSQQIDEAKFGRRKYHRGRIVEGHWILGIIQDGSDDLGLELCPNNIRSAETLIPLIEKHVAPGSIIRTDQWRAYCSLGSRGYTHEVVNHSDEFVTPEEIHTNRIESMWRPMQTYFRNRLISDDLFADHVVEYA